jgi:hypothetical protein
MSAIRHSARERARACGEKARAAADSSVDRRFLIWKFGGLRWREVTRSMIVTHTRGTLVQSSVALERILAIPFQSRA